MVAFSQNCVAACLYLHLAISLARRSVYNLKGFSPGQIHLGIVVPEREPDLACFISKKKRSDNTIGAIIAGELSCLSRVNDRAIMFTSPISLLISEIL